jgi:hypothetical protein|tara:strand:- start:543 stop:785 length:243 start_codon:yes stop_codon:yes gene_type:complete
LRYCSIFDILEETQEIIMANKIYVIRGYLDKIRVSNTGFDLLKPVKTVGGLSTAVVDASQLLGDDNKYSRVVLEDYRLLD